MLPVDAILPDLLAALEKRGEAVLSAPPGAGKTTRVPPALLSARWTGAGKIIVLAPRRLAARAAAARMAAERGERVGETIGYRVRLDSRVGPNTRIEVVTEGVFTRMILDDPELRGVAAVVFDEFHERSLDGDFGLALARDAQGALRPDLRIVIMSATLDATRIGALLADAPVIASEGRSFPIAVRYRPRDPRLRLEQDVAAATRAALSEESGSLLVFLPGAREIERTAELLRADVRVARVDIRPLYGAMGPADQDAAIAPPPPGRRKVVLATPIAETSLTIEGVRVVIDSGLARRPHFEPALGMSRLETVRASQAAIAQRAGRAGRIEPGVCVRLWSEGQTRALPEFDRPEILDADLSRLALDLAVWGVTDPSGFVWLDPPPKPAWNEAVASLRRIGALDAAGRLTEHGAAVAHTPLPPRLAHMLIAAPRADRLLAAYLGVVLTEQGLGGRSADLSVRVAGLMQDRTERAGAARSLAQRIAHSGPDGVVDASNAGAVLALGFPERVAKARGASDGQEAAYLLANGRTASLAQDEAIARAKFVVVADATGTAGKTRVLAAAAIEEAEVERLFAANIETSTSAQIDAATGAIRAKRVRRLGRIVLSEAPMERLTGAERCDALLDAVREQGLDLLDWSEAALQLRARVNFMRALEGVAWPLWDDAALAETLEAWLAPALGGVARLRDVDVARALEATLTWEMKRKLGAEAPARFETPAGSSLVIDYACDGGPALDVRLQELFGQDKHPKVAGGRIPLTLRLLSPARRPVQTTKDLPGFWRGSYAAVRADMRGRYPKHPWPDDPLTAPPTRRAKPRGSS